MTQSSKSAEKDELHYALLEADSLSNSLQNDWIEIRASDPAFRSPFFNLEFTLAVARCTGNVKIATAFRGSRGIAFLPIQLNAAGGARPAGLGINDAHGLLVRKSESVTTLQLLAACGVNNYAFHSAPPSLPDSQQFEIGRTRSFLADLTVDPLGYEHYLRTNSTTIDRQGQKTRRLIREYGPLKFEFDSPSSAMLDLLVAWKSDQYRRTHTYDILGVEWIQHLLRDLHQQNRDGLHGVLNILSAGDTPVAMHYGMLEGDLLHYWFPVFDPQYAFGSPGTQLFVEVARYCETHGVRHIDMGYGEQQYKYKLTNVITETSLGLVDASPLRRGWFRQSHALRARLKNLRIRSSVKPLVRKVFPGFGGGTYKH